MWLSISFYCEYWFALLGLAPQGDRSRFFSDHFRAGIDPDYVPPKDDPRRVVINELHIVFKENPEKNIVLKMATEEDIKNAKKHPLVIKEGMNRLFFVIFRMRLLTESWGPGVLYKFRVSFRVQHNVVLGLQIKNSVSKLGKTLDTSVEMLGYVERVHNGKRFSMKFTNFVLKQHLPSQE
jgi:hypothetical protein